MSAAPALRAAIEEAPQYAPSWSLLGEVLIERDELPAARELSDRADELAEMMTFFKLSQQSRPVSDLHQPPAGARHRCHTYWRQWQAQKVCKNLEMLRPVDL